jgi:hypothetical protein
MSERECRKRWNAREERMWNARKETRQHARLPRDEMQGMEWME